MTQNRSKRIKMSGHLSYENSSTKKRLIANREARYIQYLFLIIIPPYVEKNKSKLRKCEKICQRNMEKLPLPSRCHKQKKKAPDRHIHKPFGSFLNGEKLKMKLSTKISYQRFAPLSILFSWFLKKNNAKFPSNPIKPPCYYSLSAQTTIPHALRQQGWYSKHAPCKITSSTPYMTWQTSGTERHYA